MLDSFTISHTTDGATRCRIYVEPGKRHADLTVTVGGLIVRMADEKEHMFRTASNAEWHDVGHWEWKAAEVARSFSPFWRGVSAA